jgi:hypothetical protein
MVRLPVAAVGFHPVTVDVFSCERPLFPLAR